MKLLSIFFFISLAIVVNAKLHEKFKWKQMEFDWPSLEAERDSIEKGEYVPENNLPLGLATWNDKLFITVPRWKNGVASSLNYVDIHSEHKSPKLIPYPSWEANYAPENNCKNDVCELDDNSTIVSTFRLQVDKCDRLWVMDTGLVDVNGAGKQVAENAIVIFDLTTDKLIRRYNIPSDQIEANSFFANIIVDSNRSDCSNAYAYIPDLSAYGVVVYSFNDNESYRVKHHYFHFDPLHGNYNVGGQNFQWTDGVFTMTVGPENPDHSKDIYFHAMSSTREFKVSNRVLQNKTLATDPNNYHLFKYVGDRGDNGQSSSEVYDRETGVIFYSEVNKDAISCWNTRSQYKPCNLGLIESNAETLVFPNDLKIDGNGHLWVLTDRMPIFLFSELNSNDVNYRVLVGKNVDLIEGTVCEL